MWLRLAPTLLLLTTGAVAPAAEAAIRVASDPSDQGPLVAGKRVVWGYGERTRDNQLKGPLLVKSAVPGRPAHVIWRGKGAKISGGRVLGSLSASTELVAFAVSSVGEQVVRAGPPAGRTRLVARLEPASACSPRVTDTDTSGRILAYGMVDCDRQQIVIRDMRPGGGTDSVSAPGPLTQVRIAGRYLAWGEVAPPFPPLGFPGRNEVVVFDRLADNEVYRADVSALAGAHSLEAPTAFDLQPDGKLVVAYYGSSPGVAWFGIDGQPRRIEQGVVASAPVIARDRTALRLGSEIVAIDLGGRKLRTLFRVRGPFGTTSIGWNGRLAAWASHTPGKPAIFAQRVR